MTNRLKNKNIKFQIGKTYRISRKTGVRDLFIVHGLYFPSKGKAMLKVTNVEFGWSGYIPLDDITHMS